MDFRFTLFNSITLFILGFTALTLAEFGRKKISRNWPFLYYLPILGFWRGFNGSLNAWWVMTGLACGLLLRFLPPGGRASKLFWWVELAVLAYILLRSADLLLGGGIFYYFSMGRAAS